MSLLRVSVCDSPLAEGAPITHLGLTELGHKKE